MLSMNLKRKIAVLLTGVMVFGMTVTASAAGETSGSSDGAGLFEGHVNREVVNVTLPTVGAGETPFNFIMDNEGLIKETSHKAYGDDFEFSNDTFNVYFKTDDKKYDKDSKQLTVSNNSSVSVNVTLKVDVTAGANDPKLVGAIGDLPADYSSTQASGDPSLFLGLVVAGDATSAGDANGTYAISENSVSKTFNLAGVPENFIVSANEVGDDPEGYPHTYTLIEKDNASGWKEVQFNLTGKANKVASAEGITAPSLKVTWSFATGGSAATELTGSYDGSSLYRVTLASAVTDLSTITNVKVNNVALTSGYSLNGSGDTLKFEKATVKSVLTTAGTWSSATDLVYTFTIGGKNYTCTIAK